MISILGRLLVLLALAACAVGMPAGWIAGRRKNPDAYRTTRQMAWLFSGAMIAATFLMELALVAHDFSVSYVAEVGGLGTPLHITMVSLWSSLNGSILFWGLTLGLGTAVFTWSSRDKDPEQSSYTLSVLLFVGAFFAFLVAGPANPFEATELPEGLSAEQVVAFLNAQGDALGPNPLLQNHFLMIIHPPALYIGYVTLSVPFAMATASLLSGRMEASWLRAIRRWTTFSWAWLTLGILLGGWWSYEVLGWGGYWAWDPVENASFMPWLTATAFLHSVQMTEKRGKLQGWTISLAQWTFALTILGTFLTRSGVVSSVHNFGKGPVGPTLLVFLAVVSAGSLALFALRAHLLEERGGDMFSMGGRFWSFLAQNLIFGAWTGVVLLGTCYPMILEVWKGETVSVGEPYFDKMSLPIIALLLFFMGVGPTFPWGTGNLGKSLKALIGPAVTGLVVAGLSFAFGAREGWAILTFALAGYAGWVSVWELISPALKRASAKKEGFFTAFVRYARRSHTRIGAYTAHIGVVVLAVGVAASSAYVRQIDVALPKGQPVTVFANPDGSEDGQTYTLTYMGFDTNLEGHRNQQIATVQVKQGGDELALMEPTLNFYMQMGNQALADPAVRTSLRHDLYLSPTNIGEATLSTRVMVHPLIWMVWAGGLIMTLGGLYAASPWLLRWMLGSQPAKPAKTEAPKVEKTPIDTEVS